MSDCGFVSWFVEEWEVRGRRSPGVNQGKGRGITKPKRGPRRKRR